MLLATACLGLAAQSGIGYLEFGGPGGHFSMNYERLFSKEKGFGLRIGGGAFLSESKMNFSFPLGIQHYLPIGTYSRLQTGLGITWAEAALTRLTQKRPAKISSIVYFTPSIGFQWNGRKRGFYRLAFTPIIGDGSWLPWLGLSTGWRF